MLQSFNQSLGWSHPDLQKLEGKRGTRGAGSSALYLQLARLSLEAAGAEPWPGSSVLLIIGSN